MEDTSKIGNITSPDPVDKTALHRSRSHCSKAVWQHRTERGLRQGCILSPFLFYLYAEVTMGKSCLEDSDIGVKIGGRNTNNLCYADDTILLEETEDDLKHLIKTIVERESEKMGLQLNIKKTKIMSTARHIKMNVTINGEEIECVKEFYFLGSMIDQTGDCTPEIKHWISLGHTAMLSMQQIWKSKDINLTTKCRLVQTIVFPISIYGCESWTVKKTDRTG